MSGRLKQPRRLETSQTRPDYFGALGGPGRRLCTTGGRAGGQAESDVDTPESEKRLERAAACYTRAAANAAQTTRRATRNMIATRPWCPACQRDKTSEKEDECSHSSAIDRAGVPKEDWPATDVERLLRVWQGVAAIRRSQDREHHLSGAGLSIRRLTALREGTRVHDLTEGLQQLALIQGLLAGRGARHEARELYRQRQRMEMDHYLSHAPLRYVRKRIGYRFSWNGSSLPRLLGSLAFLYLVLLPSAWVLVWHWTGTGVPRNPGQVTTYALAPLEALIFSLSSMVTLSNGHFAPGSWLVNLLQAFHAVSAYFALGYSLYVAQRTYSV